MRSNRIFLIIFILFFIILIYGCDFFDVFIKISPKDKTTTTIIVSNNKIIYIKCREYTDPVLWIYGCSNPSVKNGEYNLKPLQGYPDWYYYEFENIPKNTLLTFQMLRVKNSNTMRNFTLPDPPPEDGWYDPSITLTNTQPQNGPPPIYTGSGSIIHAKKPDNWNKIFIYSWKSSNPSSTGSGSWPGKEMTTDSVSGWYYGDVTDDNMIILNNGFTDWIPGRETDDIRLISGTNIWIEVVVPEWKLTPPPWSTTTTTTIFGTTSTSTTTTTIFGTTTSTTTTTINFTPVTTLDNKNWRSITMSGDGTKLAACVLGGNIYISQNSGGNWEEKNFFKDWRVITFSNDGQKLVACVWNDSIYTSSDGGNTWSNSSNSKMWAWIASSYDGNSLAACVWNGYIYTSINGGNSWEERTSPGSRNWSCIASSSDGQKLAACVANGYIYTSINGGNNWEERTSAGSRNWSCIASSSDGTKLVACVTNGYIYTTSDGGVTWTEITNAGSKQWYSVSISSDGTKFAACVFGGEIYLFNY